MNPRFCKTSFALFGGFLCVYILGFRVCALIQSSKISFPSKFGRSHLKNKYASEPWFQERLLSKCVSVKDVLKFAITKPLETLLVSIIFL